MKQGNRTALTSAFSRAFHEAYNSARVFDDPIAKLLLSEEEYSEIGQNMAQGILFFNPGFSGDEQAALRWIVEQYLAPSPLGRAAFAEQSLCTAVDSGALQYLIFGAGYDSFAYRQPFWADRLHIFEIDLPSVILDKQQRLSRAKIPLPRNLAFVSADLTNTSWSTALLSCPSFCRSHRSFCSLLGLSYYIGVEKLRALLLKICGLVPSGSQVAFDYPDENSHTPQAGERAKKQVMLAAAAGEPMQPGMSSGELETLLSECGFRICENLTPSDITARHFSRYNAAHPAHPMTAFDNVNYCLAVKK